MPLSAPRGSRWSEENRGWQAPTFHYGDKSPARLSGALPGPAHTLTSLCKVQTVLRGKRAPVPEAVRGEYACAYPLGVNVCALYVCTVNRTAGSTRGVRHCQQEHRLACLSVKNKAACWSPRVTCRVTHRGRMYIQQHVCRGTDVTARL